MVSWHVSIIQVYAAPIPKSGKSCRANFSFLAVWSYRTLDEQLLVSNKLEWNRGKMAPCYLPLRGASLSVPV